MKVNQKNLLKTFPKLSTKWAYIITRLCNGTMEPDDFEPAMKRLNECYNRPTDQNLILHIIDSVIGSYGVESVPYEENAMYNNDFISYCNMGDTYTTTILWHPINGYKISNWGSEYEESPDCQRINKEDEEAS